MKLSVENINKSFGGQQVLRNVDLTVEQGEFVSLIGHSGCGKTTLINIIAGLLNPDSGRILADDIPVTGPGPDRAMVFQNYSLLPRLSLLANVREATRAAQPTRSRAVNDEMFVEVGTPLIDAKEMMRENGVGAVGVIDHDGKLVGFIV